MEDNQNKDEIENVFEDEEEKAPAPVVEPTTTAPVAPVVEPTTTPVPIEPAIAPAPVAPVEPVTEPAPAQEPVPVAPVEPVTEPTPAPAPVQEPVPAEPAVEEAKEEKPKKLNMKVIAIAVVILLIVCGAYLYFCTDMFKGENKNNNAGNDTKEEKPANGPADKFVGVYKAQETKLYIKKVNGTTFKYMLDENFIGTATATDNTAKQNDKGDDYFEFKLTDEGIEVTYTSSTGSVPITDLGLYTKIGDYNEETVYKELVGDPEYLTSKYNGQFTSEKIKLDLYQISDSEVVVRTKPDSDILVFETFVIADANKLIQYSFFDETLPEMEINFVENGFTITTHDDVFGFDEDKKELEGTYTLEKEITKDYIFDTYYKDYK